MKQHPRSSPIPKDPTERELRIYSALHDFDKRLTKLEGFIDDATNIVDTRSREMVAQVKTFLATVPERSETLSTQQHERQIMDKQNDQTTATYQGFNVKKAMGYGAAFAGGVAVGVTVNHVRNKRRAAAAAAMANAGVSQK
ncbi:MAG TPA: hypothetical protein VFM18_12385 [Methanosarcina sp.]|nr:hypothetical protein [Methanosarcina sp.]